MTVRFIFLFGILIFMQASCQSKQDSVNTDTMNDSTFVSESPIVKNFKLRDDIIIPFNFGGYFGYVDKDLNTVIEPNEHWTFA
ncbi:hypothetical protein, partial [Marinigracilibium pacificum]